MCLRRNRPQRHGLRAEAAQQGCLRLYFLKLNRLPLFDLHQIAERMLLALARQLVEGFEVLIAWSLNEAMHPAHHFRRIAVLLAVLAESIQTRVCQRGLVGSIRSRMVCQVVAKQTLESLAAGHTSGTVEELAAQLLVQPEHLEEIAIAIARNRRNTHAGDDLPQAL